MPPEAKTVPAFLKALPDDRRAAMTRLRKTIKDNLPKGFKEILGAYDMPSWVVPHSRYPDGYHCTPEQPLPFISIASQKSHVAVYHMGVYADAKLLAWFRKEYPKHVKTKLDMGKSCIRFKKVETIPYELIGELCGKMTVDDWIALYEKNVNK